MTCLNSEASAFYEQMEQKLRFKNIKLQSILHRRSSKQSETSKAVCNKSPANISY